ncbi:hypothetical protein PINS_up011984 [Pythium insidiosum]|nr:hypothetical protein PINS_up011984 [Pythium insidiosum]
MSDDAEEAAADDRVPALQHDGLSKQRLHRLLARHRRQRTAAFERDLPFSWRRCAVSLLSYGLLLSDAIRTGFAIRDLDKYHVLEPDNVVFGPYAYSVVHLTRQNATTHDSLPFWPYKYDTTSIVMRSVAQYLNVSVWSPCVLYATSCDETHGLPRASVFAMIDAMVDAVRVHNRVASSGVLAFRTTHNWIDRLNHYVLPFVYLRFMHRSCQAIHLSHTRLQARTRPICGPERARRPFSCDALWVGVERACQSSSSLCRGVKTVWSHLAARLIRLQAAYPNATLELALLEGSDDFTRGAFVSHGRKDQDVVAFTRIQHCRRDNGSGVSDDDGGGGCETIAVDDYRYEAPMLATTVVSWSTIVMCLRVLGQVYAWARLLMLVAGVYLARASEARMRRVSLWTRLVVTVRTLFLIPSQVIIYGSVFPIACYALAHLIDVGAVYEEVLHHFATPVGQYHFHFAEVVQIGAISMRSIWLMASVCHVLVAVWTRRSWSASRGVSGTPGFMIAVVASASTFAQVRSTSWRNTRVLEIVETTPSRVRASRHSLTYDSVHDTLNQLLFGTNIDAQFLSTSLLLLAMAAALHKALRRLARGTIRRKIVLSVRTLVPYSAGTLWVTNALVIAWTGAVVMTDSDFSTAQTTVVNPAHDRRNLRSVAFPRLGRAGRAIRGAQVASPAVITMSNSPSSHHFQNEMYTLDRRSRDTESFVYLMNLAAMTDPITFLRLRLRRRGELIALVQSKLTQRCFLLPYALTTSDADVPVSWHDFTLLAVVTTRDLTWWDLLYCG